MIFITKLRMAYLLFFKKNEKYAKYFPPLCDILFEPSGPSSFAGRVIECVNRLQILSTLILHLNFGTRISFIFETILAL